MYFIRCFLILSSLLIAQQTVYAAAIAKVIEVHGDAAIIENNLHKRNMFKGDFIYLQDTVQTGNNSLIRLETTNQLQVTLFENTTLLLNHYQLNTNSPELSAISFDLTQGTINLFANNPSTYVIKTPFFSVETLAANYTLQLDSKNSLINIYQGIARLLLASQTVVFNQGQLFELENNQSPKLSTRQLITKPTISVNRNRLKTLKDTRPRLENYSKYQDFLQALYLYKKAQEETIRPTIIIPNLPSNETLPEYSLVDDGYEVTNWAEDLTNLDVRHHPDETVLVKQSTKMTIMNRDEMALSAVTDILGITFFSLADFLDMKTEELNRIISFQPADDHEQQYNVDITAKLFKHGIKTPHTVGNDIVIIGTELGQSEITTISRP